jgi:rhodanese-related sulfurtransferase
MTTTFAQMAADAYAAVPTYTPQQAHERMQADPNVLLIDVRDSAEVAKTGTAAGAVNIPLATLTYAADNEVPLDWRDARLADRSRPIIVTCILGPVGAIGGKLLADMGFTNVHILEGGAMGWKDAGLPMKGGGG